MKKWEKDKKNKFALYFFIGIAGGLLLGILFKNMGLFLPLGGIIGMCIGVSTKKQQKTDFSQDLITGVLKMQ